MATRKRAAKKRRPNVSELAGLAELHDPEQVGRLITRLAESSWRDQSLRGPDYTRLDQLLEKQGDGEAAADAFVAEMAEQGIAPLSANRLFVTSPNSLPEAVDKLLHEELVAHEINPAFGRGDLLWAFVRIFCDETDREADFGARIRESVAKLDAWRRREQERTLLACPKCGSTKLSRIERMDVVYPLWAVWQDGNGEPGWEDLEDLEDDSPLISDDDETWRRSEWMSGSWFIGIVCDECDKEFKEDQLDRLVPAAEQPADFNTELIEPLWQEEWAREEAFPAQPTIEALLDDAERQVRGWWSGEISNAGLDFRGRRSNDWFYRVAKGEIRGRPMPLTLGAHKTPRGYREAAALIKGAEAAIVIFQGQHVDRPVEHGMVLIAIRPEEARTRWISFVRGSEAGNKKEKQDSASTEPPRRASLSKHHEDVEPVEQTRPLVELIQESLDG